MNELRHRIHHFMLIAAATVFFAGCGGKDAVAPVDAEMQAFEDLRVEVREAIDDPTREAEVVALVDALSVDLTALRNSVSERNKRMRQLNADYDTSRADFKAAFNDIYTEIRSNRKRVTASHQTLRAATTTEEWEQISKARTQAMSAAIKTIRVD